MQVTFFGGEEDSNKTPELRCNLRDSFLEKHQDLSISVSQILPELFHCPPQALNA